MKKLSGLSMLSCLVLGAALPAVAQVTWNYAGTCAVSNGATSSCTASAGNTLVTSAYTASSASGARYVAATLTNQGGSGIGMTSGGESLSSPNHGIDNNGNHELVLLNFGSNLVTLQSIATGWSNTDTDISILRWTGGSSGPNLLNTLNMASSGLASGWALVKSGDLDTGKTANGAGNFTGSTLGTGLAASTANSSSWWLVSSYFGAAASGLDKGNDYFKLMSVTAQCVTTTNGKPCGGKPPPTVSEPGSIGLAAAALFGLAWTRRRRSAR
jgi:MYXO-CTERM domain-containing protein